MATIAACCILIVDDNPDVRAAFAALYGRDYRVLSAASGEEALALLKSEAPQLMVLDQTMPGMNGLEVLKAAKVLRPALPVFMLTSELDIATAKRALALGASQFVTKPFDIEYLRSEIDRVLGLDWSDDALQDSPGRPWKIKP